MKSSALIRDPERGCWLHFQEPVAVVSAHELAEVVAKLEDVERAVNDASLHAAGLVAYEAASAFDSALCTHPHIPALPLLWFGLFREVVELEHPPTAEPVVYTIGDWRPTITRDEYTSAVDRIRGYIQNGDTYQVNFSFRLRARFEGDPPGFFAAIQRAQQAPLAAYLDIGRHVVCSVSPELFVRLEGDRLVSRPMKGTADRGHDLASDERQQEWLRSSPKNRAENAMIVDMVRNDMGRVATVGSVEVPARFEVERYPTVLQMTTTVRSSTDANLSEIMASMFPFASITGAPKVRTMEIIRELEHEPRGVYTGTIGYLSPGRRAQFNVAIRTVVVDRASGIAEYGVGGGIVWDSKADEEYRECRIKAGILTDRPPVFELLETMLWDPADGYFLLERHLNRIREAAAFFVRPLDIDELRSELRALADRVSPSAHRFRVTVDEVGAITLQATPMEADENERPIRLGLADAPVESSDVFLHFKTTYRAIYDEARAGRTDCDDVLLFNERGEITESTVANVVLRLDGRLVTPPESCGLLAGTYREELLERREIVEQVVLLDDLVRADAIHLINSVRRWIDVRWVESADYSPGT